MVQFHSFFLVRVVFQGFPDGSAVKNPPANAGDAGSIPGLIPGVRKIPSGKGMPAHSSILAWETPWTEEPGGLQSMGSQRDEHVFSSQQQRHSFVFVHHIVFIHSSVDGHLGWTYRMSHRVKPEREKQILYMNAYMWSLEKWYR